MTKNRLDTLMFARRLVGSRSEADSWIKLGKVLVDGKVITKSGYFVREDGVIELKVSRRYVSRAGLKLASVAQMLELDFAGAVVLDVGSSTGGFTDYALQNGAKKVYAVDVGTDQLHPKLRSDKRIELYEKTDIRDVWLGHEARDTRHEVRKEAVEIDIAPDIVVIDVSFISLRDILPHISSLVSASSVIVAMVKPQFEAGRAQINKGVIKNDAIRRQILKDFEAWAKQYFVIAGKADSDVAGGKGNRERFYKLKVL